METPDASLECAGELVGKVRKIDNDIMLAYNISPSFNWSQYEEKYI